ncbi:hypothetical protein MYCTH_2135800 [Thermothelomyces thermophilus ATCC 42464]|uniref:BZIP domain-containing protein n=1 Tax=Thermothelomyces thermophilus (strain ATCC 42464 / BCRC 31852 / DSM 1799) TaxID=573729 RepID=G2QMQ5_THET4|nr:uncharacterized protein MYCTH_2135800 [Thermothelomyces thermophilus ATCC 42464]AEO61235.1 hypothetical protein MYCTH_2135800 [Thermothelomyces thermophilus ATCC 42464]
MEWVHDEQPAFVSLPSSSTSPSYAPSCDPLQSSLGNDFELLNPFTWDQAAANTLGDHVDPASITAATAPPGADGHSHFSSPELDLDLAHCLDAFSTPVFDFFIPPSTSPLPAPPLSSATTSLGSTPATTNLQSPSPTPPSPEDGGTALIPGLKLPRAKTRTLSSKPGRRPAAASLLQTTGGRITKHGSHGAPAASSSVAAAVASAAAPEDVDPEILDRRYRNNLAAKRYRQKKIDRIEQLEKEVTDLKQERDDLRIRLARQEAEVAALREMLKMKNSERSKD